VQCPKCGMEVTGGAEKCRGCGEVMADPSSTPQNMFSRQFGSPAARQSVAYAGFWLRLVAFLIDYFLIGIVVAFVIVLPMMQRAGIPLEDTRILLTGWNRQILAINLAAGAANWLYWALMESSPWQATLGKRMFGLRVTDLEGRRISFARATGRYFGKIFFIGFIFAAFTEKKQALHDMLAGCLVIKKI
jgi:uncharacterized RDD family membrane protein YckC